MSTSVTGPSVLSGLSNSLSLPTTSTVEGIAGIDQQIDELLKTPPTEEEMKRAKDDILNSFIFQFDTPEKVLREKMAYEFYHYPLDFLERYRANIEKITSEDVARVAQKYVHKSEMAVLVVGNEKEMGAEKLDILGKVTPVDITIPTGEAQEQQGEAAGAPMQSNAEGKALIAKFVEAVGGKEKVAAVNAIEQHSSSVRTTPQGEVTIDTDNIVVYPDRVVSQLTTPMGKIMVAVTPNEAFMARGSEAGDMPPPLKDDALKTLKREVLAIAQHADDPKYAFAAAGTKKVGDVEANVVKIDADGAQATWYLDPKTNLPMRSEYSAFGQSGPVNRVSEYSDWKSVDGVMLYNTRTLSDNGKVTSKDTIKQWTLNPKVDLKLWEKPAGAPEQK